MSPSPAKNDPLLRCALSVIAPPPFFQVWSVGSGSHAHQEYIDDKASTTPNLLPDRTEHLMQTHSRLANSTLAEMPFPASGDEDVNTVHFLWPLDPQTFQLMPG